MKKEWFDMKQLALLGLFMVLGQSALSQIIISQYYEGIGSNRWIELTNMGASAINTASPQLKLGLWNTNGTTGAITFTGAPTSTVNLTITIPAHGSVLIGTTSNGTEIPYLTATSAAQTSNTVINFNGNDGIALLNSSNTIIDQFGTGINATDISYVRLLSVTSPASKFTPSQWVAASISAVQTAITTDPFRLKYHLSNPCLAPVNQPSGLAFNAITSTSISGSFAATTASGYLTLCSTSATFSLAPVTGTTYSSGATLGNATVVSTGTATSFTASGLTPNTLYYFYSFSYNNGSCTGGPIYNLTTPLIGSVTTLASPCVAPSSQASGLAFSSSSTSISGSFAATTASGYLTLCSTSATFSLAPVTGTTYSSGATLGNATVVSTGTATSFTASGLTPNTLYYFYSFSYNNGSCTGGPIYNLTTPLIGSVTTLASPCVAPSSQASGLAFSSSTGTQISGSFAASLADAYLVVCSASPSLSMLPNNGTNYTAGTTLGNGTVCSSGTATTFIATGLTPNTPYFITVFAWNSSNCSGGPLYQTTTPLTGSSTTTTALLNYYFGNFHSHSEYSDGTGLPSGDFAFGDTANCMDFLGISEHNHVSAGMSLNNWILGRAQATAANTSTFLTMYGMEWGVISGGGHVVVYGVPNLLGWDAGQYQTYVPQNVYTGTTGLFNVINGFGNNAFATLAHPNNADYNGIMSTYDAVADDAIVGSAVENGPSTSTNTTYSDPPASMSYLSFYRNMLARGYHLGPTIDHDNHNVTHGHTATSRTVVMAPSLTEPDILSAMRLMRFYATEDCSAYVTFKINTNPIGSILTSAGTPLITVTTSTSNPVTSLKIYSGIPGSGTNATILTSTTTGSITFTHTALTNLSTRYYYIDITESDGKRIITAPIWYTRNDAARLATSRAVAEFFAVAETNKVILKWITTHETNQQLFLIEKSMDNVVYVPMSSQQGKGVSSFPNTYSLEDTSTQNDGITYYRLTQYDTDGAIVFTQTQIVARTVTPKFEVVLYPNPVTEATRIALNNTNGELVQISIFDLTGQLVYTNQIQSEKGNQEINLPLQDLRTGIYLLTMQSGTHIVNTKISKL